MSDTESDISTSDSDVDSAEERPTKIARVESPGDAEGDSGSGSDADDPDDDDDDDLSGDADEYEDQGNFKRKQRRPINDLIIDMADVSDGDDEYETDGEEGIDELLPAIDMGKGRHRTRSLEGDNSRHMKFMQQINELDGEKIVEAIAKRFSGYNTVCVAQDDEHSYEIQQQKLLPGNHLGARVEWNLFECYRCEGPELMDGQVSDWI